MNEEIKVENSDSKSTSAILNKLDFVSARKWSILVAIFISFVIFLNIVNIYQIVGHDSHPDDVEGYHMAHAYLYIGTLILRLIFALFIVVFFMAWISRVNKNLIAFGMKGLRFSPGWAVGYWFVPIANLYRPYMILDEIWRASSPQTLDASGWKSIPSNKLILVWWVSFLVGVLLAVTMFFPFLEITETSLGIIAIGDFELPLAYIVSTIVAILALIIMGVINQNQVLKAQKISTNN